MRQLTFGLRGRRPHEGLFGVARTLDVPVVPVAIRYDPPDLAWVGDAPFVPHYLRLAASRRAHAVVRLGSPMSPGPYGSAAALASATRARVLELLTS